MHIHTPVCIFAAILSQVATADAYDLTGTWHVAGFDLPTGITLNKNAQGVVTGLSGGSDSFHVSDGFLTIDAAGAVSGAVEGPITGTATVSADGIVNLALLTPEPVNFSLPMTTKSDLMATSHSEGGAQELLLLAKAPTDALPADIEGSWWVMEIQTPATLGLKYNGNHELIEINGTNDFKQSKGTVVIDSSGNYNYNTEEDTGAMSVNSGGIVTITSASLSNPVQHFYLNASKDVMIRASGNSQDNQLTVLVKKHEVHNWEAAGKWATASLNYWDHLYVSKDNLGRIINIDGLDGFKHFNGTVNCMLDSSVNGVMETPFSGYTTGAIDGTFAIYHGEPAPFNAAMSASGDFFVGVGTPGNDVEVLVAIRSVRPLDLAMVNSAVLWVPGDGRFLEQSASLTGWLPVASSGTTSSYSPSTATDGSQHFYRLKKSP